MLQLRRGKQLACFAILILLSSPPHPSTMSNQIDETKQDGTASSSEQGYVVHIRRGNMAPLLQRIALQDFRKRVASVQASVRAGDSLHVASAVDAGLNRLLKRGVDLKEGIPEIMDILRVTEAKMNNLEVLVSKMDTTDTNLPLPPPHTDQPQPF